MNWKLIVSPHLDQSKVEQFIPITSILLYLADHKDRLQIEITAKSFYGARHGLSTLQQLIWYDDEEDMLRILNKAHIKDAPKFRYIKLKNYLPSSYRLTLNAFMKKKQLSWPDAGHITELLHRRLDQTSTDWNGSF